MNDYTAIIDIGTTSVRVVLYDEEGKAVASMRRPNPPRYMAGGAVEQDPKSWGVHTVALLTEAVGEAKHRGGRVEAIALTAQRSSVIAVDRELRPLHPAIMWQDTRASTVCADLAAHEAMVHRRTGVRMLPVFSAPKIRWLRQSNPSTAEAAKYLGIQDLVLASLTGRIVTDRSFAGRTNLYNVVHGDWDEDLLELFDISRPQLAEIVDPGSIVGTTTPEIAHATGLPTGCPVVTAGGDQQCAALGLGLYRPDRLVTNTGTGSYVVGFSPRPAFDPDMRLFTNPAAVRDAYTIEATIPTTGTVYRWLNSTVYDGDPDDYTAINEAASSAPPGAHGVRLRPYFQGSGSPTWDPSATGTFSGLTLAASRADLARATLEGIAGELTRNVELIETFTSPIKEIHSAGGLTSCALFNQILADAAGKPIIVPEDGESTARGAWISAVVGLGRLPTYEAAFELTTNMLPSSRFMPREDSR